MDRYIDILKASGADAWEVFSTEVKNWEFYYIGHRLDQNRAKNIEHVRLCVYKLSEDGFMGMASAEVPPTETDAGIRRTVEDLVYQAGLVKNKPYRLNVPKPYEPVKAREFDLREESDRFIKAMDSIHETATEYLNSYELFTSAVKRRLVNSEGVDVTENYLTSMIDLVVNARKDDHKIELYRLYHLGGCDREQLRLDIEELMRFGRDRLIAKPTPAIGSYPVVFSTDAALSIYSYFLANLEVSMVLRRMSSFELGKPVTVNTDGDKVTLKALRELPNSPSNFSCDPEGAPIRDAVLIDSGVPQQYVGGRMFSQYLGLDDTFIVSNWSVSGGSTPAEGLRSGKFLEIVEFSDFQVDGLTGDIFGEIRLGYFHDGEGNVTPVSGGSISGNMKDNLAHMRMSRETRRYASAEIPKVTRLENITVSGVDAC